MTTHDDLLAAILDNPADDLPRLVYADWLEENVGTPDALARCEFIRVQCEIPRLEAIVKRWSSTPSNKPGGTAEDGAAAGAALATAQNLQHRERELFLRHSHKWNPTQLFKRWLEERSYPTFSRGFVSGISLRRGQLEYLHVILREHPIEVVEVEGVRFEIAKADSNDWYAINRPHGAGRSWMTRSALVEALPAWIESVLPSPVRGYASRGVGRWEPRVILQSQE